ncbi:hypothetical protein ADL28_34875 [Streptomyces violaceusniger]|uniref:Integral membrane protein n=2 Tax=Streptomyces violaceusniger group TaxID=2839105 RepID=A0ABD5JNQ2_9ACTN|nr:hypothetical protein [Streptomyces violaceusniger]KUL46682.1 hypothetical protein ADL28_34875 [Streptomyces violaceusniger]MEE4589690.1 hypothetical protein [Streptomyces sp. DSM 41602]WTB05604.1 hypothetical protein OG546_16090 [Streptomyces antimycoticus]
MSRKKSATAKKAQRATARKTTERKAAAQQATARPEAVPAAKATGAVAADAAPTGPRPTRLTVAAVLAAAEGVVLLGFGVYVLIMGLTGDPESPQQAEMLGVTVVALALLPLLAARGLWLRRRWSRGPAMITQLMALPVAWTLVQNGGGLIAGGVVTAIAALAVMALLINPTATEALGIGPRDA